MVLEANQIMIREEINRSIRNTFENILKNKPHGKELARKKEIDEILRKEKEEYEQKRAEFYNNPLHWDNNKRRRHHLPVLRGRINKGRSKRYHSFRPTSRAFFILEDVIDEVLTEKFKSNEFFNQFVDIKDISVGDENVFYVTK